MESREVFMEFLMEKGYTVASTFFTKSQANLVTFRNTRTDRFAPPFSSDRFAQIDHILVNQKWKNIIHKFCTSDLAAQESDHKILTCKVKIKLAKIRRRPKNNRPNTEPRQTSSWKHTTRGSKKYMKAQAQRC